MARVTVEDCVLRVPNRFDLVMLAAQRSRDLSGGAQPSIDLDNDKNPVVALREIADGTIDLDELRDKLIHGLQKHAETDEPEEDDMQMTGAATGSELLGAAAITDAANAVFGERRAPSEEEAERRLTGVEAGEEDAGAIFEDDEADVDADLDVEAEPEPEPEPEPASEAGEDEEDGDRLS